MKNKTSFAVLLLSSAWLAVSPLSAAYAHDEGATDAPRCEHPFLSQDKRDLLHKTFEKSREDNKAVREDLHKLREERNDLLAAKTFNKSAFLAVTAKIEKKHEQLDKGRAQAFASIADKFTPEEREHIGRMLSHRHHHGGWQHAGWKQGPGPHQDEGRAKEHAPSDEPAPNAQQ